MVVQDEFIGVAHRIVWCGVATVDRRGRPRSRILHPIWERTAGGVRGWVVTRRSPLKTAHLERTPYLTCTYWDATHDVAIADCHASWEDDRDEHARVWALYAGAPDTVARKIAATAEALGIARFDMKYSAGTLAHEKLMRSIELYGSEVIPRVRELIGAAEPEPVLHPSQA